MKTLIVTILATALVYFGYQQYTSQQQEKLQQEHKLAQSKRDKQAFDKAKDSGDPKLLFRFIHENPDSAWLETAQYHLEKLLVENAIAKRNIQALEGFIRNYPKSDWTLIAKRHLTQFEYDQKQQITPLDNNEPVLEQRKDSKPNPGDPIRIEQRVGTTQSTSNNRNDARERVNRALSIYSKVNKQKTKQLEQQKLKREEEEKIARLCIEMKDQLKQFRSNVRWYELDEQGNRVYIDKDTVSQQKQTIQENIQQYCQ